MKRQHVMFEFFKKKPREDMPEDASATSNEDANAVELVVATQTGEETVEESPIIANAMQTGNEFPESTLPDCWSTKQGDDFKKKYDGLFVHNKKLGCNYCAKFDSTNTKGTHVSAEWKSCSIEASGKDKTVRQASLRKKLKEHFSSKAHQICCQQIRDREKEVFGKCLDKMNEKYIRSTCKVFNTVYSMAKRCRPFSDIEDEIALQVKNGLDVGIGLHSRKTAVKITDHIASEIKKELFTKIINKDLKICVIIDEASTISCKSTLIIFLKVEDSDVSPTIFLDLVELEAQDAETIYISLLRSLHGAGFDNEYLKKNLVAVCSDGASVMLGRKSGVSARLEKVFPNIIIWHCLSHRLQLVLDDSVADIKQVNHFKIFLDKIYAMFHQSNKKQTELFNISQELGLEIIKIGRVLGPRWAACSLRSALAVWRAYPALFRYFSTDKKYSGMANRLGNKFFLDDLAIMIDILQEMSLLSNALQARNVNIARAEKLIQRSILAFEMLKNNQGIFEKKVETIIKSDAFKDINFTENRMYGNLPRIKLLEALITNMKSRLMHCDCDHSKSTNSVHNLDMVYELVNLLEPDSWKIEEVVVPWKAAEEKLGAFQTLFNFEINVNDFRDFCQNVLENQQHYKIPETVAKAKNILGTIAVSSAEAERGFSTMNIILSDKRSRLTVPNVANLITINRIGLPLEAWDACPSVKSWLRKCNHTADDVRVKKAKSTVFDSNQQAIWNYFNKTE